MNGLHESSSSAAATMRILKTVPIPEWTLDQCLQFLTTNEGNQTLVKFDNLQRAKQVVSQRLQSLIEKRRDTRVHMGIEFVANIINDQLQLMHHFHSNFYCRPLNRHEGEKFIEELRRVLIPATLIARGYENRKVREAEQQFLQKAENEENATVLETESTQDSQQ